MAKIVLGVCGGIASYKSVSLASLMVKKLLSVKTVMTESACKFVGPLTFKTITSNYVYTGFFENSQIDNHTTLAVWADLIIIAPITANTIAKIAHGFADNLLSALILDYTGPVFIAPAMHENMWNNPATRKNIKELINRDFYIIGPESGDLAGGKKGEGRMAEPESILNRVEAVLKKDYPAIEF